MKIAVAFAALLICATCFAQAADTINLVGPDQKWLANTDGGTTTMDLKPTADAPLAVAITCAGKGESYPKLRLAWKDPQDWSKYTRLRMRVRVSSTNPADRARRMAVVLYDDTYRHEEMEGHPWWQQCLGHSAIAGRWIETTDWLINLKRTAVQQLDLYLYEDGAPAGTVLTWEFAQLQLEGVGDQGVVFDSEIFGKQSWPTAKPGAAVGEAKAKDGFALKVDGKGNIVSSFGGKAVAGPSGLLVRDVTKADAPPVAVGGKVTRSGAALRQQAEVKALGLAVDATYKPVGDYLEVAGIVRDTTAQDRAITLYLGLPVGSEGWRWWDSASKSRTQATGDSEFAYLESGMAYGLNGQHSKYPLGALSPVTPPPAPPRGRGGESGGLTLGVRMDEPVVHRIGYSPAVGLFYVALDLGLVPEKTVKGKSLAAAPFRFLVYRHDPKWGFRSALQRYYDFFPEFFADRIPPEQQGGWFVWGKMQNMPGAKDAGFRCHWGPDGPDAVKWDNANGTMALQYIEAEFFQETLGDYTELPTLDVALDRLRKIAAGDETEMAKFEKLGYSHSYVPGQWVKEHSHREAIKTVAQAAAASVNYEFDGSPTGSGGKFPWMNESQLGVIFPCNLDPDIPGGKGAFCRDTYLETGLKEMEAGGAHYDGIALDSFGGYGQHARANYRREHFKYVDCPLTFAALDRKPCIAMWTSSVEWVRDLAQRMHGRKLVLMANCSWGFTPGWLTFAAPYLDILGAEAKEMADPDYARAIARHKILTDLPYEPVPAWQMQRNQLHDVYPGHGNKPEDMTPYAATFRDMAAAGWEPITHATVQPAEVGLERYGTILALHNPTDAPLEAKVKVDTAALKLPATKAELTVPLEAKGTAVVRLR